MFKVLVLDYQSEHIRSVLFLSVSILPQFLFSQFLFLSSIQASIRY